MRSEANEQPLPNAPLLSSTSSPSAALTAATGARGLLGRIELRDVHFTYAANTAKPVLRGINLTIKPGEKVALVGARYCVRKEASIALFTHVCLFGARCAVVVAKAQSLVCWSGSTTLCRVQ